MQQTFTYNSSNELIRVDDEIAGNTVVYEYNGVSGNIKSIKYYAYTTANTVSSAVLSQKSFSYTDSNWSDLLTSVDGNTLTYDALGNVLSYNGYTYTWTAGRHLSEMTNGTDAISLKYDDNGIRTEKTVNGVTTHYTTVDGRITGQYDGTNTIYFRYNAENSLVGFNLNGTEYIYIKNIQGDIEGILDQNGDLVVEYTYDAWGKVISTTGTFADTIGTINPMRYRDYYLDSETGYYYLQSRYYNPDICRFINADEPSMMYSQLKDIAAYNLLAYCLNNPINMSDEVGYQPEWAGAICRKAKNTYVYKYFVKATQKGWFSKLFYAAGFIRDSKGVYHARQDCWQRIAGYNDIYDWAFNLGTSMKRAKFPFSCNGKSYIFWAWKGDYLNLGAGAELGIYYGGGPHWLVDSKLALKMTLTLKYNGRTIIKYNPGKVWWLTGFNPYYQNVKANKLTAIYTIYFSSRKAMFNAFHKRYKNAKGWTFNAKKYTATYKF